MLSKEMHTYNLIFCEEEEEAGLKFYLSANKEAILAQAKQIDPLTNWLRMPKKE